MSELNEIVFENLYNFFIKICRYLVIANVENNEVQTSHCVYVSNWSAMTDIEKEEEAAMIRKIEC